MIEFSGAALLTAICVPTFSAAFFFWRIQRRLEKREAEQKKRDEARKEYDRHVIRGIKASTRLSIETAKSVKRLDLGCNGDMSDALTYAQKVECKLDEFMQVQGIENLH